MSNERYPRDLVITLDDFRISGWREAIEDAGEHGYSSYWQALSKFAGKAMESGAIAKGKVLWLLADACSMMLKSESVNEPFHPLMILQQRRSAMPEDFSKADLTFFDNILPEIDDNRLEARIADILWFVKSPRKVEYALQAIDSYMQFPLDDFSLLRNGKEAWERAIRLSRLLNKGAADRLQRIRDAIFSKFQAAELGGKFHALWLSELLEKAYLDEDRSMNVATKLEEFAKKAIAEKDWNCAREYYEGASRWCKRISAASDVHRLHVEIAETWVSEAEQRTSGDNPSNMVAGHFLESAIQTYRKIPRKERAACKVDERIEELHGRMNHANKLALDEMIAIETPGIDISQSIEASRDHVSGRNFPEVLLAFANIHPDLKVDALRESAKKNMQRFLFRRLFGSTHMTRDGRVCARSSSANFNTEESPEMQAAIWQDMIQNYQIQISLVVQASILPALQVLNAEHRITERFLLSLCHSAHIVPPGREVLWAKGLFYGFESDFVISTHLLIPQLEHLVRAVMKQNGLKTTTLDSKGIETENGLSALLEHTEIEKALDKNLFFEFKALLTDSVGPNLRNEVAHGLLEAEGAMSIYAVYLWWLCLRLVIKSIPWKKPDNTEENKA